MAADEIMPTHPGVYIRENVIPVGMSVKNAAELLGVGRPALSNLLNGKAALSSSMALRFEAAFGVDASELLELQGHFDRRRAKNGRTVSETRAFVPPFLQIKSGAISGWADKISARTRFAVFLRILVHSTGRDLERVDFPGNDEGERSGWDGYIAGSSGSPWIPEGSSGWEFGCNKKVKDKADKDYEKSLKLSEKERAVTTFVFVTPRKWSSKKAWEQQRRNENQFKDVRVYDASDLEQWLEQSIPAQVWFNSELERSLIGAQSLEECWTNWCADCTPKFTVGLFQEAVASNERALKTWRESETPKPLLLTADSSDEALAYLYAALEDLDDVGFRDQVVVVSDVEAASKLFTKHPPHFIPVFTDEKAESRFAPFANLTLSVIVYPRNVMNRDSVDIELDTLSSSAWSAAMTDMGCTRDESERLSNESGNSLTVLRRRLSSLPSIKTPLWAQDENIGVALANVLLAGTWKRGGFDEDIIALLANQPNYESVETEFLRLLNLADSPVWSIGSHRGVVSKIDALFSVFRYITAEQLDRFFDLADLVLSEEDPSLDLPEEKRWMANIYGKTRQISGTLRDSIAESLVLLSVHGNSLFRRRLDVDSQARVASIIRKLLTPCEPRKWESHGTDLPFYAEAAPDEFLSILEEDLQSESPTIYGLMREADTGIFGGCPRAGFLWALESLAWSPDRLSRVVLILAQISNDVRIEDNWSNKPSESLSSIFRNWMPQTTANLDQRIECLKLVCNSYPSVGWNLCKEQFSSYPRVGHYSHKPKWRNEGRGSGEPITVGEARKFAVSALQFALAWNPHDLDTLTDLLSSYWDLYDEAQEQVRLLVKNWIASEASDTDRAKLRETVRVDLLGRRGAKRAGNQKNEDKALQQLYDLLVPDDLIQKYAWLFNKQWVMETLDELEEEFDHETRDKKIQRLRVDALQEILLKQGVDGLHSLSQIGDAPRVIGWAVKDIFDDNGSRFEFLHTYFRGKGAQTLSKDARFGLMSTALLSLDDDDFKEIMIEARTQLDAKDFLSILLAAPFGSNTWVFVDNLSSNIREEYWSKVIPRWNRPPKADIDRIVRELINVNRPLAAFDVVHLDLNLVDPSLLYELMEAIPTRAGEELGSYRLDPYHIDKALERLTESSQVSSDKMARLEFTYIDALRDERYGIPNLERELEKQPGLFAQAIAMSFKRDDGLVDPEELQVNDEKVASARAMSAYHLLDKIRRIPGTEKVGVNQIRLERWLHDVRKLCKELGRLKVADVRIGQLLAKCEENQGDMWPCEAVCNAMENLKSNEIGEGFYVGVKNARGVHWRGEGGDQERELSEKYQGYAMRLRTSHPFVSKVLQQIADSYEREADEEDTRSQVRKRLGR